VYARWLKRSGIVRQSAYSGVHRVKTNGDKDVIEQPVPLVVEPGLQERAISVLGENKRYPNRENDRWYLLRGLVRCAAAGGACASSMTRQTRPGSSKPARRSSPSVSPPNRPKKNVT